MRLALALLLLAAALMSQPRLSQAEPDATSLPGRPQRLALLLSANVSAACTGRCTLRAAAAACDPVAAVPPAVETRAAAALEDGWNSIVLGRQTADALLVTAHVDCVDPACAADPPSFLAWRGGRCSTGSGGSGSEALLATHLQGLPAAIADDVYVLNSQLPALAVTYSPQPRPTLHTASAGCGSDGEAAPTCPPHAALDASSNISGGLEAGKTHADTAGDAGLRERAAEHPCDRRSGLALKAALAAWVLGCAALGVRL